MKKIIAVLAFFLIVCTSAFAQMLSEKGVKNTLSTSFGLPYDRADNSDRTGVRLYGLLETLQVRLDVSKFTAEGMLNWGALTWWDAKGGFDKITFENTGITPFWYTNNHNQGGWWTNPYIKGYYVNFLWHPLEGLDFGMGTRLNWVIGPAPSALDDYWGAKAHVVQGGLEDAAPGAADVVGYTYYANCYTSLYELNTKSALGLRYHYEDFLEVGVSLPSGVTTSAPLFNAALKIHPVKLFSASVAYEGILRSNGNLYTGLTLDFDYIMLDAYLAINFRNTRLIADSSPDQWGSHWGTGAAITFNIPKINMTLRPETGFSFYNDSNYTTAWYIGGRLDFAFAERFELGTWSSFAIGSADKRWHDKDYEGTKLYHPDYTGGNIFDIRPELTWNLNKNNAITVYFDFQNRLRFTNVNYNTWASGLFWTCKM